MNFKMFAKLHGDDEYSMPPPLESFKEKKAVLTRRKMSFCNGDNDNAQDTNSTDFADSLFPCMDLSKDIHVGESANDGFGCSMMDTESSSDTTDSGFSDFHKLDSNINRKKLQFDSADFLASSSGVCIEQPCERVLGYEEIGLDPDGSDCFGCQPFSSECDMLICDDSLLLKGDNPTSNDSAVSITCSGPTRGALEQENEGWGDEMSFADAGTRLLPCHVSNKGKNRNVRAVTPATVAALLRGEFPGVEAAIVDCRYPYEYEGGHIKDAVHLYTQDQVLERFLDGKVTSRSRGTSNKQVIIFHCEFSLERGPKLLNFLREQDRRVNEYPALHYPDIYILEGGYKAFWEYCNQEGQTTFCEPQAYTPMLDDAHAQDLKSFRRKSNTKTSGGVKSRSGRVRSRLF